jgi:hypothetical protein
LGPCSWIGKITENLEGIQREARKCRQRQGAPVEIYEAERPYNPPKSGVPGKTLTEKLRAVRYVGRLHYSIEPLMPWGEIIRTFESATS